MLHCLYAAFRFLQKQLTPMLIANGFLHSDLERQATHNHSEQNNASKIRLRFLWRAFKFANNEELKSVALQSPYINFGSVRLSQVNFRRCVLRTAALRRQQRLLVPAIAQAEVRQFHFLAFGIHQDVLQLDVAMDDAAIVQMVDGRCELASHDASRDFLETSAALDSNEIAQILATELKRHAVEVLRLDHLKQRDDRRVVEL